MKSTELLDDLRKVQLRENHDRYSLEDVIAEMRGVDDTLFTIGVAAGAESVLGTLFEWRNVDDELQQAYEEQYPGLAAEGDLHSEYAEKVGRGPESVQGFRSGLRGKVGELRAEKKLEEIDPTRDYSIATDPNQAVWDIEGVPADPSSKIKSRTLCNWRSARSRD